MSVSFSYIYNRVTEELITSVSNVQVVMVPGLYKSWHQPIFYDFDKPVTTDLLMDLVPGLHSVGFEVRAINCDLGPKNIGLLKWLKVSEEQPP